MARRLEQATEEALFTGGRAGRRAIEDAGFSEELKARLLDKVAAANFQAEHSAALAHAGTASRVPDAAGLGTRSIASAQAWTGQEATEDAVLRMLDDARKPLAPGLRGKGTVVPAPVDMRLRREAAVSPGQRAAGARDKAQEYVGMGIKDTGLSAREREAYKKEMRERFAPGARTVPASVSALAALANERIEDAIARGQFKNIPRGTGIQRDTRADNPFIDTTEYIMNNMIKRQDIVPPWIEKQQELARAAENFRGRLRYEWKRHAARIISSGGGTLEQQIARAAAYARAEEIHNPCRRSRPEVSVSTSPTVIMAMSTSTTTPSPPSPSSPSSSSPSPSASGSASFPDPDPDPPPHPTPASQPFRDPAWLAAELAYHTLAVANLNSLARSYNLMAPDLAKKPYFSLERELRSCFAHVAPLVAEEIRVRATRPPPSPSPSLLGGRPFGGGGGGKGGLFGGHVGKEAVVEGREKRYGLRELWRDLVGR
ncbi:hypothetical protein BT67DRAFT_387205 [Trichocladium antarcticum]|uniref:DnaJ homologue subfamily C member 28 conserved domain-containing protein n=1 Tax=Trichocladium antarcticum TaxID=1450529 RepID=A0AAN6UET0_9PEZI|nr:hypothetical protein BT67DRAFT_387205 [Trichocladium antarcticum]